MGDKVFDYLETNLELPRWKIDPKWFDPLHLVVEELLRIVKNQKLFNSNLPDSLVWVASKDENYSINIGYNIISSTWDPLLD